MCSWVLSALPHAVFLSTSAVWVSSKVFIPIGWNSHSRENWYRPEKIVPEFCQQAGFNGRSTNHSGKVTCATQLFVENVDEQLIKLQTGHRSDTVRAYKCPTKSHALHASIEYFTTSLAQKGS